MSEFNNRISAQRRVLNIVNNHKWQEELFGLAGKAIDRWLSANKIDSGCSLAMLVRDAGAKLFFLANKSQEQITDDYKLLSDEVEKIVQKIYLETRSLNQVK